MPYPLINLLLLAFQVQKVLPLFHRSLQNFTVTFEELKKLERPENYPVNNMKIRKRVINGMAELLTQVGLNTDRRRKQYINRTSGEVKEFF
jgi:hypothetical protein